MFYRVSALRERATVIARGTENATVWSRAFGWTTVGLQTALRHDRLRSNMFSSTKPRWKLLALSLYECIFSTNLIQVCPEVMGLETNNVILLFPD